MRLKLLLLTLFVLISGMNAHGKVASVKNTDTILNVQFSWYDVIGKGPFYLKMVSPKRIRNEKSLKQMIAKKLPGTEVETFMGRILAKDISAIIYQGRHIGNKETLQALNLQLAKRPSKVEILAITRDRVGIEREKKNYICPEPDIAIYLNDLFIGVIRVKLADLKTFEDLFQQVIEYCHEPNIIEKTTKVLNRSDIISKEFGGIYLNKMDGSRLVDDTAAEAAALQKFKAGVLPWIGIRLNVAPKLLKISSK